MNLFTVLITGLTVGGLSCLAVQGGLLASTIATRRDPLYPTIAFLLSKLIGYTILGFLLGAFGAAIGISQQMQIIMQFAAGIYMIAVGLHLLNVHPIFRYVIFQPPKSIGRFLRNKSKSEDLFAPAVVGFLTIFIPCGTTLAIEALAISSGSALWGAVIMATFVIGTMPMFLGIGLLTRIFGENFNKKFFLIAAIAVIYLGLTSLYGALVAWGAPITKESFVTKKQNSAVTTTPTITIQSNGYNPNYITVKKGSEVTLTIVSKNAYSCASAFRIPSLGIQKNFKANETYVVKFTPTQTGKIPFSCSMGMFTGVIEVI